MPPTKKTVTNPVVDDDGDVTIGDPVVIPAGTEAGMTFTYRDGALKHAPEGGEEGGLTWRTLAKLNLEEETKLAAIRERVFNGFSDHQDARFLLGLVDRFRT